MGLDLAPPHLSGRDAVLLGIGVLTALATISGGALALRLKSSLGLLVGFGAGAVLGVALFDLLPEALTLGAGTWRGFDIVTAFACGFTGYLVVDRCASALARGPGWRGHLGAATLTAHSLMDGLGVGLAFKVSAAAGVIVAVAVLAHDCVDGANTVTLTLAGGNGAAAARRWLIADAVAPLCGIWLSSLVTAPRPVLALALAAFGGFFLYVGASELLPQAFERRPRATTTLATILGLGVLYAVVRLSGG